MRPEKRGEREGERVGMAGSPFLYSPHLMYLADMTEAIARSLGGV